MRKASPKVSYNKIGPALVEAVRNTYANYLEKPTPVTRRAYLKWRLRAHLRCNVFMKPELVAVNEYFELGLNDDEVGELMWEFE